MRLMHFKGIWNPLGADKLASEHGITGVGQVIGMNFGLRCGPLMPDVFRAGMRVR